MKKDMTALNEEDLLNQAEELIEQSKLSEAKDILLKIINSLNPNSLDALNNLAVVFLLEGNYLQALEYIQKVLSIDSQNELALNNLNYMKQVLEKEKEEIKISDLSIIIPVFNKIELTLNCLRSLNDLQANVNFEVIIIDNNSQDSTEIEIQKLKDKLKYKLYYKKNNSNLGFAKANNLAVELASYDNLLFLNNDTVAKMDFLTIPLKYLNNSKVGIVGIKLLYPDNLIQHAGIVFNHLNKPEHLFRFYKSTHPLANGVYELQAVTGACLFIRKEIFKMVNGFDEQYINGWEDMDICFKVRQAGYKVLYTGEVEIYHLESQSERRLNFAKNNETLFFNKYASNIENDKEKFYEKVRDFNSQFSFKNKYAILDKLNIAIKIGVPNRSEKGWGDIYFANSLSKDLTKLGHNVVIHYLNEWNQDDSQINLVIHIKGLSEYKIKKNNINFIWVINHPELHSIDELNQYDTVLVASKKYYDQIKPQLNVPCYFLPQATDEDVFNAVENCQSKNIDILFVGNNYEKKNNKCREIIADLMKAGKNYNMQIIGSNWKGFVPERYIKSEFISWEKLPMLYRSAKIILNDHQESMRENGFINNRTYDLAFLNAFQISNYVEGMEELGIITYKNPKELENIIEKYLYNDDARIQNSNYVKEKCSSYTFTNRAIEIINYLKSLANTKAIYTKCNICGYIGEDFLDMGVRKKVRCPKCNSLERQRALWYLLNRDNMIRPNMKVLEIAPLNNLVFRKYFEDAGCQYICIDKWKHGNPLDKRDTSWIDYEMDICSLEFDDETFDLVIVQHVIEEVPDDLKAFMEIARVLKSDGYALLEVPHDKNLRKTIEYDTPQKFGNLRKYGVDFYSKIESIFSYRKEIIIDNISFSKLGKTNKIHNLNFPILLDHPASNSQTFNIRFNHAIKHLLKNGFTPLTTAQVNNLIHKKVYYEHPVWFTFDDGSTNDIDLAYPILKKYNIPATSFLIPKHLNDIRIKKWQSINDNKLLDIQNHSLNHYQCFVSPEIVGIKTMDNNYPNLMEKISVAGTPIFEYASCLKSKRFIPNPEVIEEAIKFYEKNKNEDLNNYLEILTNHLHNTFGKELGKYESEKEFQDRIYEQIETSSELLSKMFNADIYAFSFPWGIYSDSALLVSNQNHTLKIGVNPKRINHDCNSVLERIEITGSAYPELINTLYTTQPWEDYEYKNYPMVSVLMTTYNRQDLLPEAIQSVVNQTFKDWNLIIVNDGGEDVSDIIKQFDDPRIKYFSCSHKGKAASLNFAIQNSQSKYVAYLDDDDKYYPNHLEVLTNYLETHKDKAFVYSTSREVVKKYEHSEWKVEQYIIRYSYQATPLMLRLMNHIPNLAVLHSRSLFAKAGMYDEKLDVLIDWDMYRRLAVISAPVFINEITSEYSKRIYDVPQEKQITGLFFKEPVRYYQNRLYILNKQYPPTSDFINNDNCVIIICDENNYSQMQYLIAKTEMIKRVVDFDIIMICNLKLNERIIDIIQFAESKKILTMMNEDFSQADNFIKKVIDNNGYRRFILLDAVKDFNGDNVSRSISSEKKVTNFSKYLRKVFPINKTKIENNLSVITVSIIIPTFNNWNYTKGCLKSIFNSKMDGIKYEIIIVDNCSSDETRLELEKLVKRYPNLITIYNDKNLGFAAANNIAAKKSNSDYLLFLNNDTEVFEDWLSKLVNTSIKEDAAVVGAKLIYPDRTIQHAGVVITEYNQLLTAYHPFVKEDQNIIQANAYRQFQAVTGACLLIKRKVFLNVGMFSENFLNGYEDIDLCFKVNEIGEKIYYCPEVKIIHHESKTHGRFDNANENIKLLNEKWKSKIKIDDLNRLFKPVVSIVIPVHNQITYTKSCIESIKKFTHIPYELIIVDDASNDGTAEYLNTCKDVIIKKNKVNRGYPISCNIGIQASTGDYIVLLNNDTIVTENWLNNMLEVFKADSKVGIVGPVSNSISGFQLDKSANYSSIDSMHLFAKKISSERKYSWMITPRITFVCAVIRKELIETIGGLDERFSPGNFEDDDFCLRTTLAGYKIVIAQDVFIHHYGSMSFKSDGNDEYNKRLEINRRIFVDKWGADPEEIWLKNKKFNANRSLFVSLDNDEFVKYFELSKSLIDDKDYVQASVALKASIAKYDFSEKAKSLVSKENLFLLAANINLVINDFQQAKSYFESALELNPSSSEACKGLAKIFLAEENYEAANTMFGYALVNNLDDDESFNSILEINSLLKLENDISINENNTNEAELAEVEMLIENKNVEKAEEKLLLVLSVDPFNVDALNNYAVVKILKEEHETALKYLRRVFLLDENNEVAKNNLEYIKELLAAVDNQK